MNIHEVVLVGAIYLAIIGAAVYLTVHFSNAWYLVLLIFLPTVKDE